MNTSKLLVPLDGSHLAEEALPYAVRLAKRLNSQILLFSVVELGGFVQDNPAAESVAINAAEEYLQEVSEILTDHKLESHLEAHNVQTLVVCDEPMRELPLLAAIEKAGLIIMTTHGRNGLSRLVLGSNAATILQHSALPVLLLHPTGLEDPLPLVEAIAKPIANFSADTNASGEAVVVTLDGSPEAEMALEPAIELARSLNSTIYLLKVVTPVVPINYSGFAISYYGENLEEELATLRKAADGYLNKMQARVLEKGLDCIKTVCEGDPAIEIVAYASKVPASILVMATHARGRVGDILLGSVAEKVMRQTHLPVMMVNTRLYAKVSDPLIPQVVANV